jgi:hypothetical protein
MAAAHRGLKHSPEHRAAIAAAATPENIARASAAAVESVRRRLADLGAVSLASALEVRGINYGVGYAWATHRGPADPPASRGELRPPIFRGPRRMLVVREIELEAELERWRCTEPDCTRYALLSNAAELRCAEHTPRAIREYLHKPIATALNERRKVSLNRAQILLGSPSHRALLANLGGELFIFGRFVVWGVDGEKVAQASKNDPKVCGPLAVVLADRVGRIPLKRKDGSCLTDLEVQELEALLSTTGWTQGRIAIKFGLSRDQVKRHAKKLGETPL